MIYEEDNRYPEVARPFEKVRGVKKHGAVGGEAARAERTSRMSLLKRYFTTATAAAASVAVLTAASSEGWFDPGPAFSEPKLRIEQADFIEEDGIPSLSYQYTVELNSAGELEVTAAVTANGSDIGTDGPYRHEESGTQEEQSIPLTYDARPESLTLTLRGTYEEGGETRTVTAETVVSVPEKPFAKPSVSITNARLPDDGPTPLTFSYQVELNDAESLSVNIAVTSEGGEQLGIAGPFTHDASKETGETELPLSWTKWPETVTLTLTGTYNEKGETKTVTAETSLPAPFTAPVLSIGSAALSEDGLSPLTYTYDAELNAASDLTVTVRALSETGAELGTDEPFMLTSSGTSGEKSLALAWTEYPETVTLVLTGTYQEKGEEKAVTAETTLQAAFLAPVLEFVSAELDETAVTPLAYSYSIVPNSAKSVEVTAAAVSDNGEELGTSGPFTHTIEETGSDSMALAFTRWPLSVTLTLTAAYEEDGETKTVTAEITLQAPEEPFTDPAVRVVSASQNTRTKEVTYTYEVTAMNSASSVRVRAHFYNAAGTEVLVTDFRNHTGAGSSGNLTCSPGTDVTRITVEGIFSRRGQDASVTASGQVQAVEPPFAAPSFQNVSASLPLIEEWADVRVQVRYTVNLGDAESVNVETAVISAGGVSVGDDEHLHTATESRNTEIQILVTDDMTSDKNLTVTLTGTYQEKGVEKTITKTVTVPIVMAYDTFMSGGEAGYTDGTCKLFYWAEFAARPDDPHVDDYTFEVVSFTISWYDSDGNKISENDQGPLSGFVIDHSYDVYYTFEFNGQPISPPDGATHCGLKLKVRDTSSGKTYTTESDELIEIF